MIVVLYRFFNLICLSNILYLLFYSDYEKVLELEPNNFEATNELRKINQVNWLFKLSTLLIPFI